MVDVDSNVFGILIDMFGTLLAQRGHLRAYYLSKCFLGLTKAEVLLRNNDGPCAALVLFVLSLGLSQFKKSIVRTESRSHAFFLSLIRILK